MRLALKTAAGVGLLLLSVALAAALFRSELNALGEGFVRRFGVAGMCAGAYLADAVSFPVPPQFYLLAIVVSGGAQLVPLLAISLASVLGGHSGYHLARRLSQSRFLQRRVARAQEATGALFQRHGLRAVLVGSVMPVPFSMLCYLAGVYDMPYRLFALFSLLRVPRMAFFYLLIRVGWGL